MNKYTRMNWENAPSTATPLTADNLNHMDEGIEQATDGAIALETEIATARGSSNSLGIRLDTVDTNLAKKADKTNTLAGYGIINAYTKTEMLNLLASKADKATTLAGYEITDAYTKEEVQKRLGGKLDSKPFDDEPKQDSPCYLTSGTIYNALQTKADVNSVYTKTENDNLLGEKADKAEVETALMNKANLVNSPNIFDFDKWADYLSGTTSPRLTIDNIDKVNKSISITAYDSDGYTNHSLKFTVKPNTTYTLSWSQIGDYGFTFVYLNGVITSKLYAASTKGVLTFETKEDTGYITLRFGIREIGSATISKIMLEECDKKSLYLPYEVAGGVPEVADEILAFEKTTQTSLDKKYDSSNIELGTATLTPYSTQIDKIKSATCLYEKIGDIVIVNVTVIMNATSLGGTSAISLLNMPFSNKSDVIVHDIGVSKNGGMFRGNVTKSAWLQFIPLNKQAYDFVADEQVNFSLIYKI